MAGIGFQKLTKLWADRVGKVIKPFAFIFLVFLLTFGLYTNRYVFSIIGAYPKILLPALLQPYLGFTCAFLIAKTLGKQPRFRCITIAIEAGVQNIAIPMTLLQNSFDQPMGDLAAVMPVTTALFTPIPLMLIFLFIFFRKRLCPTESNREQEEDEKKEKQSELVSSIVTVVDKNDADDKNHVSEPFLTSSKNDIDRETVI